MITLYGWVVTETIEQVKVYTEFFTLSGFNYNLICGEDYLLHFYTTGNTTGFVDDYPEIVQRFHDDFGEYFIIGKNEDNTTIRHFVIKEREGIKEMDTMEL